MAAAASGLPGCPRAAQTCPGSPCAWVALGSRLGSGRRGSKVFFRPAASHGVVQQFAQNSRLTARRAREVAGFAQRGSRGGSAGGGTSAGARATAASGSAISWYWSAECLRQPGSGAVCCSSGNPQLQASTPALISLLGESCFICTSERGVSPGHCFPLASCSPSSYFKKYCSTLSR